MSAVLYALGRWAARAKWLVLAIWLIVLVLVGSGALMFSKGANAPITIPGTESQAALETLSRTFPEVSGTSAQLIVVAPEGEQVSAEPYRSAIVSAAESLEDYDDVLVVQHPFSELIDSGLNDSERAALMTVQIDATMDSVAPELDAAIQAIPDDLLGVLPAGTQASYGGEMYSAEIPGVSITEALGVAVAFIVLILTLGTLAAAGMPLIIALIGVAISIAGMFVVTAFVELTSTTPMLALMLGLAVGIDYTLFIVSRHQEQLRDGVPLQESIARATATSGSAVVFAGLTVIIALVGLSVAQIPFLTALGLAAAAAVAVAVIIAVTLTPAIMSMAGMRILSKRVRKQLGNTDLKPRFSDRFFGGWVKIATAKPLLTTILVLAVLAVASIPTLSLRLALPNASGLAEDDPARVTYELTAEQFGEGHNGPLVLAGSIITSTDPLGLMEDLADEVRALPGVADVPLATPNMGADTGIIQVVPEEGPHAESTAALVEEIRAHHDEWESEYGVSLAVTGFTAVGIDVSRLLFEALVPFSIFVVGLSLILLAMVFRSVWVPIKATLGYLLSVGVAFGATVAVFQWGWFAELLNVHATGPILSFMPIILMGVLFGLAMDYEVFLVARMREEVVHGSDSQQAIHRGFVGSGKVVSAAAIIMFAVFVAFVPEGDPSIKVIALGLAVGVFVDAFIVRMILVPAVLALLGDHAWRMPQWLQRVLPHFDVEGEQLERELRHENWPEDAPESMVASEALVLTGGLRVPDLRIAAGEAVVLHPVDPRARPLAAVLSGRGPLAHGLIKVDGLLQPDRASTLRRRSAWATPDTLVATLNDQPTCLVLTGIDATLADDTCQNVASALDTWMRHNDRLLVIIADPARARDVLPIAVHTVTPLAQPALTEVQA